MHILSAADTVAALPYDRLVPELARAATELAEGRLTAPDRQVVTIDDNSVLLSMPAIGPDIGVTKLITVHGDNARHRLPAIQGEVIVFDTATGRRLALLDGPTVTARRTAAMTLLGIDTLAPRRPASVLIIGTGIQAAAHVEALVEHFDIGHFWIVGTSIEKAAAFTSAMMTRDWNVTMSPLAPGTLAGAVPPADVIVALTRSTTPVLPAHLPPTTLAIGVGAFKPTMAELPAGLLHHRPIVVDHRDGARHEAGDLIRAKVDWKHVIELGDILSGKVPRPTAVPVFKTVGQAAWDLAAARVALAAIAPSQPA